MNRSQGHRTGLWWAAPVVLTALCLALSAAAQMVSFPYRDRGGYCEGVLDERPISGVEIQLLSLCAVLDDADSAKAVPDRLHLAFVLPPDTESADVCIFGPRNYTLNNIDRQIIKRDPNTGLNVFSWNSSVVRGLGIAREDLQPRVVAEGNLFVPCFIWDREPEAPPATRGYLAVVRPRRAGSLSFSARVGDEVLASGSGLQAQADIPIELVIPARPDLDAFTLHTRLDYGNQDAMRSLRQEFTVFAGTAREPR